MTQNDSARTLIGTPVVISVLANNSSIGLTIIAYTQPVAGTLTFNPDQTFTYTPSAGFEGVYRPRLVGHRLGAYAARATAESCSSLIAAGGRKPCRSISQAAL